MKTDATIRKKFPTWEFPDFDEKSFKAKASEYAVCVFVINEGEKIRKQIKAMQAYADSADIIIADGGSTDGSLEEAFLEKHKVRTLLTKRGPGRLSAQMRMAFAYVLSEGYKGVIVVDGNGKDDISAIPDFARLLAEGYDHIQGSRFITGGKAINTPLERLIAVKFVHSPLISLAARHHHTDTTNGFRAYSRSLLEDPEIAVFRNIFQTYELHYHLAIESGRTKRFKLTETPVTRTYPKTGKTPTKISPLKGNAQVMGVLLRAIRGKYKKPV